MDMVGRDDCDDIEGDYSNTVFVVGADRISTDLHNLIVETNSTEKKPLALDYELNDPADPEGVYTRSDHYSYAPRVFRSRFSPPDFTRITTATAIPSTRFCSPRWLASHNWFTKPVSPWPTRNVSSSAITRGHELDLARRRS